ncbi:hypothetical protein M758_7G045200 [Ceratodon purpureus]|nr:hypothetical protein M758_7G045200 [Ceratodon purpureus]
MEETNETAINCVQSPSIRENVPSNNDSSSVPSSNLKIQTEAYSVTQQDKMPSIQEGRGEQLADWETTLEQSLPQFSTDDRNVLTESTAANSEEQARLSNPHSRSYTPGEKSVVFQELERAAGGPCSSDQSLSSDNSPRRSPEEPTAVGMSEEVVEPSEIKGVGSQEQQPYDNGKSNSDENSSCYDSPRSSPDAESGICSSYESSSSVNSPSSTSNNLNSDSPSELIAVVGGPSSSENVGPSPSEGEGPSTSEDTPSMLVSDTRKRHSDPHEIDNEPSVHSSRGTSADLKEDPHSRSLLSGPPRLVPIAVYLVAPKSVEVLEIRLGKATRYEPIMEEFSLGKGIDGKLYALYSRGEFRYSPREAISVVYTTRSEENDRPGSVFGDFSLVSSIKNRVLDAVVGERSSTVKETRVRLPNHGVHVDVCNDQGEIKTPRLYNLIEWLAVLRILVASSSKFSLQDSFSEYFHKRPNQLIAMFVSWKQESSEALRIVLQWASHLQDEFRKDSDYRPKEQAHQDLVTKQGLFSVALLEIFVALRSLPDRLAIKEEDLASAFLETLVPLQGFFRGVRADSSFLQQEEVRNVLQATMGHLVSCVSPFIFSWVDHLDLFAFFDPTLSFLNGWSPFRFGDMSNREVSRTREKYEDAIRKLCCSSCFRSPPERLVSSRCALKAAPTIPELLQAAHTFEERGLLLGEDSNTDAEHVQVVVEALDEFFSKITEQHEKPGAKKARLQRQLELALTVEPSMVYPFLSASFRERLLEVLQEIVDLDEQSQGVMKDPLFFVKSRGKTLTDTILSLVTSPYAFNTPLQPYEVRFIRSLSAATNSKIYDAGKAALVSLINREISNPEFHEVLKVWIQGAARKKAASIYLPPHSFLVVLEELLDAGVETSLASPLSQMAMSMAEEECRSLPAFLQDSKNIKLSQARLVQEHYLNAAGRMMEAVLVASQTRNQLGKTASDSLEAVCQQTNRGTLVFLNPIGEQLCFKLLDTTMKACIDLQGELELRPIETVVEFKFATLLMQIEKCPQSVRSHALYKDIRKAFETVGSLLKSGRVSLRYVNLDPVRGDWERIFQIFGNPSFVTALEEAHKELVVYRKRLEGFKVLVYDISEFLTKNNITVEGCTKWRDWFERRSSEWENFTLSEINSSPNHWPSEVHKAVYEYLDPVVNLHRSRIFLNVLREVALDRAGGNDGLVQRIPSSEENVVILETSMSTVAGVLFPQAVNQYQDEMRLFVAYDINFDKIIMERVCILLNEVDPDAVEIEFELARKQLGGGSTRTHDLLKRRSDKETNIVDYLQFWKGVNVLRELHTILPLVASVFDLDQDCGGLVSRIWNVITECTPRCSLRCFREVLQKDGQNLLAQFSTSEVDTLKELTKTGELVMFLRETVQEELRHLLDAVEDPNATQTWEGLINDLIDLQRIFRPILSAKMVTFEDLRASIFGEHKTSSSNFLCEKLKACNKEASKLRRYFQGVANRMHKDNDQIASILKSGKYHFLLNEDGCSLELKCNDAGLALPESSESSDKSKSVASSQAVKLYNLPQLQELRSRARWTIASNAYVKKSKTAQAFGTDEEIETSERSAIVFISHIDVAEQIVAVLTKLHSCGHFSYAKFERVIPSFAELQILADLLKSELGCWEGAMAKARNDFLCLNFFRSVELRLIVQEIMQNKSNQSEEKLEHCLDLFKWTGISSVNLESVRRLASRSKVPQSVTQIANRNEGLIYNCLRIISSVIDSSIFQRKFNGRPANDKAEGRQGIILADVDDPQGELNAIATLFAERDLVLQGSASHVIICGPLTAWEDIYLLTLRYLKNVGQKDYFYCIAYIERLSFDCLSQLLTLFQNIVNEYPVCENELGLVSCSRSKILQTLSQRLQIQVRHMASRTTDAIGNEADGRYSKMWVITSDLPGMGKTRHVQKFAETNHVNCMRTLTISGEVSRNLLIQRLKKLFMHPPNQSTSSVFLHLDISVSENPETLNDLLFELLVLGCLKSDSAGLFHLPTQHVAIEVANTYHNFLASKLPVCRWFKTEHLVWNIHNFVPSNSETSDDQFVYNYLQKLQDGNVDAWNPDGKQPNRKIAIIPFTQCRQLLDRHFVEHLTDRRSISFSLLRTFTKFFAQQLREFSECPFFVPENLAFMRAQPNTRSTIVRSILEVSRDLSIRSVKAWLDEQQEPTVSANTEALMTARMDNMLRWSDSKHVMIFFHLTGRIAVLYKEPRHVPSSLVDLFHKQKGKLPHYESLTSEQLYEELWPILHRTQPPARDSLYVLTADNFLKMALIFTKVKANVPVVIMGETGCGKTSLLRQLAHYCCVAFLSITLHAGTTEDDIRKFLIDAEAQASNQLVWAFLDEINACNHLGFLVGVVCHHLLDGRALHHNVKILAACNPYRKHDSRKQRAGLSARRMLKSGNVEHLDKAYTVHPLPEALVENVQDFGVLNVKDERLYIEAMVLRSTKDKVMSFPFTKLLVMSQVFVKEKCGEASVSLRDARRCIDLFNFFCHDLTNRPQSTTLPAKHRERRAALLSFAHCYYYRLESDKERTEYKAEYVKIMNAMNWRKKLTMSTYSEAKFEKELIEEQMALLDHMEIEPGIAKNQALRENVFVTLTCILQKIPLFVVGKPGSGKTLSLQLIFSNLRGSGMKDPYFRLQPTMFMFSYQGSESSTSEGILKVFEKAYRCVEDNKKKNVNAVVVVVLDEVGLAEISSHNPLKVLHSLLEPDGDQQVAVVGISNWGLDAAKMNRAIHISQPDPCVKDLVATGEAILDSYGMRKIYGDEQMIEMKWLAKVYHEYHEKQSKPDFHGLRDFYSLIKSLRGNPENPTKWTSGDLKQALWRNFGGSPNDTDLLISILSQYFRKLRFDPPPALDLVKANLDDKDARHLMLISTGESAIGIVESMLPREQFIIVHGSKYKDDCSDDYAYLMLSNIILHMEAGRHIVLKGVERIWSSLYDMLNQHYTIVSGRRNCRIAIGAFSNPMCFVHENFRCIVVVDRSKVQGLDPPFLNRFEKQVLTWEAILTPQQKEIEGLLKKWVKGMACISEDDSNIENLSFCESDLFANYSADTVASLVLLISNSMSPSNNTAFLDRCKEELLLTAYPDGMMRAHYSRTCLQESPDAKIWTDKYFRRPGDQESLLYKIQHHIGDEALWKDNLGIKLVVTTRSNIHTDIRLLLEKLPVKMQIIKLGDFTAERQLNAAIQQWSKSENDLLIIQSDTVFDKDHLPLAKVHVERARTALLAQAQSQLRHVVFILHSHRGEQQTALPFSFLSGWKQITLDQLNQEHTDYREYLDKSIAELVQSEKLREGQKLMVKVLTWSFLCIKYPRGKQSALYCQKMVEKICNDNDLCDCFARRAVIWLEEDAKNERESGKLWQTSVVCNRGRLALASNLHYAFLQYIEEKFREPIARLIYVLENKSALGSYFNMTHVQKALWRKVFMDREMINIENVPQPMHPEGYIIKDPMELKLPFSSLYAEHVDTLMQELYLARVSNLGDDDDGARSLPLEMAKDVSASLQSKESMLKIEQCAMANPHDYCHDFAMLYAPYQSSLRPASQALVFEWLLREKVPDLKPLMLHALVWTKLGTLKAQALLASSCYTEDEISTEVKITRSSNVFTRDFDDRFASKCVLKMLPLDKRVIEKAGGLEKWLHQFGILIKLVSNISIGGPRIASIMLMLQVLKDFAQLVIWPLSIALEDLCSLAYWFERQRFVPSPDSLITKIMSLVPNMNTLRGTNRDVYFRFVASTFSRLLDSTSVTQGDISAMSTVIFNFNAPTCLMKGVVVRLLHKAAQLLIPAAPKLDCPPCLELFLLNCRNVIREQPWSSETYEPFVLLSDVIYESVKASITPELLSGVDKDIEAFSFNKFHSCVSLMTKELTLPSGRLNLRVACSFALLRNIMEVLAQDLVTVQKKDPTIFKPRLAPVITKALTEFFNQNHSNVLAMKQYLMKVLRYHCGFSIQNVSYLANECRSNNSLKLYSLILDWEMLKEVDNPLGFNPFTTLFPNYERADELLWNTLYSEGEKLQMLKRRIQDLRVDEQGGMASAVASKIFLVQASRNLFEKEVSFTNWLQQEATLQSWDKKWVDAVHCLAGTGPLQLISGTTTSEQLQFRTVAAHILLVVSSFSSRSPLRECMTLEVDEYVLALPDNLLAALQGALNSKERLGEYKHSCGYMYVIGNCTQPNQRAKCPNCGGRIGGSDHVLDAGNVRLEHTIEKGYIPDHVARSDPMYTVRGLEMKAFRALRLVVHYCILLGLFLGHSAKNFAKKLSMPVSSVVKEVETLIEEDLVKLGTLLNCNREVTYRFMHSVVASMATQLPAEPLNTPEKRRQYEMAFGRLVKSLSERNVHQSVADYIDAHRGRHELTELLEERRLPPFPAATAAFTRILVLPNFKNYQAMYMQDETRRKDYPIVGKFFEHMERLSEMKHLMGLVRFSKAVHEQLCSKVTRPEAASRTVGEYLSSLTDVKDRHIQKWFPDFAKAWNVMRLKVTAFECTEFKKGIPEMNVDASIGFCLVESRDLGIYLAAILDHLRTIQNTFLGEVAAINQNQATTEGSSPQSVKVQMCKAEEVIDFDEQWPHTIVCHAGMANLQFSQGQNSIYDEHTIAQRLQNHLVDQKPLLDPWEPFLYKHEAFHKHMTILSDVGELVRQLPLGSETLQGIQNEIEFTGTVGAGRYLATLDLCLGFLRRTGGDPTEALSSYCKRWLGDEALLITRMHSFRTVQLQHIVSLYEGLEDSASVGIEALVNSRYRTPLTPNLVEELESSVEVKRPWQDTTTPADDSDPKISAELFHGMLRRFLFRYLISDQLNATVPLSIYITDPRLIRWPEDVVDDVDDAFPPSLLVEHSHATYVYLSEMLKVGKAK